MGAAASLEERAAEGLHEPLGRPAPLGRALEVVDQAAGGEHVAAGPDDDLEHPGWLREGRGHRLIEHGHAAAHAARSHVPESQVGERHVRQVTVGQRFRGRGRRLEQSPALRRVARHVPGDQRDPPRGRPVAAAIREVPGPGQPAVGRGGVVEVGQVPEGQVHADEARIGVLALLLVGREGALGVVSCTPRLAQPPEGTSQAPTGRRRSVPGHQGGVGIPRRGPVTRIRQGCGVLKARRRRHPNILAATSVTPIGQLTDVSPRPAGEAVGTTAEVSPMTETFNLTLEQANAYDDVFVPALFAQWVPTLLRTAGVTRGTRVLDVACGTGVAARGAAELVGPSGRVSGVDLNPAMIARRPRSGHRTSTGAWRTPVTCPIPTAPSTWCCASRRCSSSRIPGVRSGRWQRVLAQGGVVALQTYAGLDEQPAYGPFVSTVVRHAGDGARSLLGTYWSLGDLGGAAVPAGGGGPRPCPGAEPARRGPVPIDGRLRAHGDPGDAVGCADRRADLWRRSLRRCGPCSRHTSTPMVR